MQGHWHARPRDTWRVGQAEHLLQLHGQHRRLARFVFELKMRTARYDKMRGRIAVELQALFPIKLRLQGVGLEEEHEPAATREKRIEIARLLRRPARIVTEESDQVRVLPLLLGRPSIRGFHFHIVWQ